MRSFLRLRTSDDAINDAVCAGFFGGHVVIALGVARDLVERLAGRFGENAVELLLQADQLPRLDLDVAGLALGAAHRLVDHDSAVREGEALAFRSGSEEEGAHARGLSNTDGGDITGQILHRVVNRETRADHPAWTVDIQGDIGITLLALQKEELGDYDIRHEIIDRFAEENDAILEQPRVDIISALAARIFLDDVRYRHCFHSISIAGDRQGARPCLTRSQRVGSRELTQIERTHNHDMRCFQGVLILFCSFSLLFGQSYEEMERQTDMNDPEAVFRLAQWCAENRMPSRANQLYARVIKLDPNHVGARTARGEVLVGNRWVSKSVAEKMGQQSSQTNASTGAAAGGNAGRATSGQPGPSAREVGWDLRIPDDPSPGENDVLDHVIASLPKLSNDSQQMSNAVATLLLPENWPSAFARLCAALQRDDFLDIYAATEIIIVLQRERRFREAKVLLGFAARASERINDAEDLAHFAMAAAAVRERRAVPRLIELLGHAKPEVREEAKTALAVITRLPPSDLTPQRAQQWWNANWSRSEEAVLAEQLKSQDPAVAIAAAEILVEARNPDIFPVIFKALRGNDAVIGRRALDVLRRATGMDWGIDPAAPLDQRIKRIEHAEKWWQENRQRFTWPGLASTTSSAVSESTAKTPSAPPDPDLEAVNKLGSTMGSEAVQAETRLRGRGRAAVAALLKGLDHENPLVRRRAYDILREVSKRDFPFDPRANEQARAASVSAWRDWARQEGLLTDTDSGPAEP